MIEYLVSLSLLAAIVLLLRSIFRKSVSPRAIYALWLVVVIRMLLPITLFEVGVTLPEFIQSESAAETEQGKPSEELPMEPETIADAEQIPVTPPVQTPTFPLESTAPTIPVIPSVTTPVSPVIPVTPFIPTETTPVTPILPEIDREEVTVPETPTVEVPEEPVPVNWEGITNLVWFIGAAIAAVWVILTTAIYTGRLYKDREYYKTVRGIKVYISKRAGVPCIAGLKPSIYITPEAANSKSETLIIVHEYVHLRHGDHIWAVVRALALIVFWWNPLILAAAIVSKQDAELACDDSISAKMNEEGRLKYANILFDTIPKNPRYGDRLNSFHGLGSAPMKERILMLTTKQKNKWICVVLAVVLALCAVGCSFVNLKEKETEGSETNTPEVAETKENDTDEPMGTEAPEVSDPATLSELPEGFEEFYHEAEKVYALFTGYPGKVYADGTINVGSHKYQAADINGYTSLAELRALCEQYFDSELTEQLMGKTVINNAPLYIEQDGKLYRFGAYVGQYGIEPSNYRITLESKKYGNVTVSAVWQAEGRAVSEEISCTYALQNDGTIRFTNFCLMAEALFDEWIWKGDSTHVNLPIPEITVEEGASHPGVENVIFRMGNNYGLFSYELAYYRFAAYEPGAKYSLNLPEGYENGKFLHVFKDDRTGAIHFIAEALNTKQNETVYLDYELRARGENSDFELVSLIELGERQLSTLRSRFNTDRKSVYPCYDVYHCNQSVSIGTGILTVPTVFTDYRVIGWEVIYCEDGCDPTDILRRAYVGYTPEYLMDQYEEYTVEDGWNYPTRRYIDEKPRSVIDFMDDWHGQIHAETIETVYLLNLGENLYAYIHIGDKVSGIVSRDDVVNVNEIIKNTEFTFLPTGQEIPVPATKADYDDNGAIYRLEVMPTVRTKVDALPTHLPLVAEESCYSTHLYVYQDGGMTYYLHNGKGVYYKHELQLPKGYSNGEIVRSETTEGFSTISLVVSAEKDGLLTEIYYLINCAGIYPVLERVLAPVTQPIVITDLADWDKLPWPREKYGVSKPASNAYSLIHNMVSGESEIPEYNGLGIKDYSVELLENNSGIYTLRFNFTVTGMSLPETLLPGTYSWKLEDGIGLWVFTDEIQKLQETGTSYVSRMFGMDRFENNSAVQAVHKYLNTSFYRWEIPNHGDWKYEEDYMPNNKYYAHEYLPYNYICRFCGEEDNAPMKFNELQRLFSEKFGIVVDRPTEDCYLSGCKYVMETDTVEFADTRGLRIDHRILDAKTEDGVTYVIVQLFADKHRIIPSHKVQYAIGEGEVFLGCEIIQEGKYEPRELNYVLTE